ncbi:hypothetical protein N489_03675 [Lactococcus lactis subsp. lactis 1AA59]|nr:hypothetical protein N489_03675 [Lactococcus lactis subsp. lactis 1AA59]
MKKKITKFGLIVLKNFVFSKIIPLLIQNARSHS